MPRTKTQLMGISLLKASSYGQGHKDGRRSYKDEVLQTLFKEEVAKIKSIYHREINTPSPDLTYKEGLMDALKIMRGLL